MVQGKSPCSIGGLEAVSGTAYVETQAEAASDSKRFSVSGYFRTSQINVAACSFGLLRPAPIAPASWG